MTHPANTPAPPAGWPRDLSTLDRLVACDRCGRSEAGEVIAGPGADAELIPMWRDPGEGLTVCRDCLADYLDLD